MPVSTALDPVEEAQRHVNKLKCITVVGIAPMYLEKLTTYDMRMLAQFSGTTDDVSTWTMADLLAEAERRAKKSYPNNVMAMTEYRNGLWDELCDIHGKSLEHGTRLNMRATANAFPAHRRRHTEVLRFSHHKELVGMDDNEQDYWLDMADAGGWSVGMLKRKLYAGDAGVDDEKRLLMDAADTFTAMGIKTKWSGTYEIVITTKGYSLAIHSEGYDNLIVEPTL